MNPEIERRAVALLRSEASRSLTLRQLHVALVADAGVRVGSYAQFRTEIARRNQLFVLVEPGDPLAAVDAWEDRQRAEYDAALAAAGIDLAARVLLAETLEPPGPFEDAGPDIDPPPVTGIAPLLRRLDVSLVTLSSGPGDDPALRADLARAMAESEQIRAALYGR
jgi:hypothetical protein